MLGGSLMEQHFQITSFKDHLITMWEVDRRKGSSGSRSVIPHTKQMLKCDAESMYFQNIVFKYNAICHLLKFYFVLEPLKYLTTSARTPQVEPEQ